MWSNIRETAAQLMMSGDKSAPYPRNLIIDRSKAFEACEFSREQFTVLSNKNMVQKFLEH